MKRVHLLFILIMSFAMLGSANAQVKLATFTGAKATLKSYKALYVINSKDEKKIAGTLRNMRNAMNDSRLKGKLKLELIAFGDGVAVYDKKGTFEKTLLALKKDGVILAECENTVRERKIEKSCLFDFINYVPSGNGEIIIRQYQGWAVVHP
ncbi:intracellular sulfur oxidation DsrE/DsrF family protein [Pedobacter sp. UYP30]|uniref:DsrE family protein n=1 Tax=Pedobacter sp. UYP30 TaxID=1756400 RepID=UPI0033911F18